MAKTYMFYKVKFQGNTVAQFATAALAVNFIKSLPGSNHFVINYDNKTNVWNTAEQGVPNIYDVEQKVEEFRAKQDARFEAKMASFASARKVGA
jgi:hypothetical protein